MTSSPGPAARLGPRVDHSADLSITRLLQTNVESMTDRGDSPRAGGLGGSPVRSAEDPPSQSGGQRTCAPVLSPGMDAGRGENRSASPSVGSSELSGSCRLFGHLRLLSAPRSSPAPVGFVRVDSAAVSEAQVRSRHTDTDTVPNANNTTILRYVVHLHPMTSLNSVSVEKVFLF